MVRRKAAGNITQRDSHTSKRLEHNNGLFVIVRDTLLIIEIKFQKVLGSVDEKRQTCDFKRKQYSKLVHQLNWKVEYVYVLNDWYKNPRYQDTLDYIHNMNCHYLFNVIAELLNFSKRLARKITANYLKSAE
nr:hypothetical protein [Stenoxybacter acetivorans]